MGVAPLAAGEESDQTEGLVALEPIDNSEGGGENIINIIIRATYTCTSYF